MNNRFNKDNYSRETISKFDIVGSYFVDQLYNIIYKKAKNKWTNTNTQESLTFIYIEHVQKYAYLIDKSRGARRERLEDLFEYYISKTKFKSYVYSDFLNVITKELFPTDYFDGLKLSQKQEIFEKTVVDVLNEFISKLEKGYMQYIIDDHDNRDNTALLRDLFIDCLLYKREEWYVEIDKKRRGDRKEFVPKGIVDKITIERNSLIKKIKELTHTYESEKKEYDKNQNKLMETCQTLKVMALSSHDANTKLQNIIDNDKIDNSKQSNEIINLKNRLEHALQSNDATSRMNQQLKKENTQLRKIKYTEESNETTINTLEKKLSAIQNDGRSNERNAERNDELNIIHSNERSNDTILEINTDHPEESLIMNDIFKSNPSSEIPKRNISNVFNNDNIDNMFD